MFRLLSSRRFYIDDDAPPGTDDVNESALRAVEMSDDVPAHDDRSIRPGESGVGDLSSYYRDADGRIHILL